MKIGVSWGRACILGAFVVVVLIGLFVFWYRHSNSSASSESTRFAASKNPATSSPPLTDGEKRIDAPSLEDIRLTEHTMSQLVAKGLPLESPPRRKAVLQTAEQTTEQVVQDLGNLFTIANSNSRDTARMLDDIGRWSVGIPKNVKVARLIQEGREKPDKVTALLKAVMASTLESYDTVRDAREVYLKRYQRGEVPHPNLSEKDDHYQTHRKYSDMIFEYDRLHYMMYGSLYILANINRLDAATLYAWLKKTKAPNCECKAMDVWLVAALDNQLGGSGTAPKAALDNKLGIPIDVTKIAVWNAPWPLNDPIATMANIDMRDIPTIDVLSIPLYLPIEEAKADEILAAFRQKASAPRTP